MTPDTLVFTYLYSSDPIFIRINLINKSEGVNETPSRKLVKPRLTAGWFALAAACVELKTATSILRMDP
jgi:hypothetical protein